MLVGYGRVSTQAQSLDIQNEQLLNAGCEKIFIEKQSGASTSNRQELARALEFVREGDKLVIYKLDRLARSIVDLHKILNTLNSKGVKFKSLTDSAIDTTNPQGILMLNILGSFAQFERELIRERQAAGIAKAKAANKYQGRKKSMTDNRIEQLKKRWSNKADDESAKVIATEFNISRATLYRYVV